MNKTTKKAGSFPKGLLYLFLLGAVLILFNLLISDISLRIDATENNIYSLSPATKKILDKTKNEVTLKYFSNADVLTNVPGEFKAYSKRIYDLLKEYAAYGDNKIKLQIIRPGTDSEEEDKAVTYGLQGVELQGGQNLYIGLVAISFEREEVIPFFNPSNESKIEYELTRIISDLQSEKRPETGILSSINIFGNPASYTGRGTPPWYFLEALKKQYNIKEIDPEKTDSFNSFNAIILFQPKKADTKFIKKIEDFVKKGGRLAVISDPLAVVDSQGRMAPYSFPMKSLFKKWGIIIDDNQAVIDINAATRIMGRNNKPELNPAWLSIDKNGMNSENIITSDLESILLPIAGTFKIEEKKDLDYEILISSSKKSSLKDPSFLQFGGIEAIKRNFTPDNKKYPLAVKISGNFSGKKENIQKKGVVVYISDADFLFDQFYMQRQNFLGFEMASLFNDNLVFFQNCMEILCGQSELIDIRSRSTTLRPFTKVKELENIAKARWLETEKSLAQKAAETTEKIKALEKQRAGSHNLVLSREQEDEIKKFRLEKEKINEELKKVRRKLKADIESLGIKIKMLNILLIPSIIAIIGIITGLRRRNK
ncbi:MAG: hypothetical protein CSA18_03440 [Deltaproteobacteria bacterium]|nr:MAG: hypothetical protein CSA18_03440 [Deltaproteobacteria bacterium]